MKSKIVKSKKLNGAIIEIIEHCDDFGKNVNYSVIKATHGEGARMGVASLAENIFSNYDDAIKFFDIQN